METVTTPPDRAELIAKLYQIAIQPEEYGALLNAWDDTVARIAAAPEAWQDAELLDHADRAGAVLERLEHVGKHAAPPLCETITADRNPAVLFGGDGRVLHANAAASEVFGAQAAGTLRDRINGFAEPGPSVAERLRRSTGEKISVICLLELAIAPERPPQLFALSHAVCAHDSEIAAMLTAVAPVWGDKTSALLRQHFDLTNAEIAIARALCNGETTTQIAQARDTSTHTVRSQIKAILEKTPFTSQIDLVRQLGFLHRIESSASATARGVDTLDRVFISGDGRRMQYRIVGAECGTPVLFLHGLIDSVSFPKRMVEQLRERDLTLVVPVRPAFGASDPLPDAADPLAVVADDCDGLLKMLGIERAVLVGHMAGALYAHGLAARYPDRAAAVLSVAGAVPMQFGWQFTKMSQGHRISGRTARYAPRVLPLLIRGGIQLIRRKREDDLLRLYFRDSPEDRALINTPELRALMLERFEFVTRQGHRAFLTDILQISQDWRALAEQVTCETLLLHGSRDHVVVVDGAKAFADAAPHRRLEVLHECGQLLLTEAPERVVDMIGALVDRTSTASIAAD